MNDAENCFRRHHRFRGMIVGCVCLLLVIVEDRCGSRVALGALREESIITVRNPQVLPPQIVAERIPLGNTGDYKPSLALLLSIVGSCETIHSKELRSED